MLSYLRFAVCTVSMFIFLFSPTSYAGKVQCKCVHLNARGEGNWSCVESDSPKECVINYNSFDEDIEKQATTVLADLLPDKRVTFKHYSGIHPEVHWGQLEGKSPEELTSQILVYLLVGITQNSDADEFISRQGSIFKEIYEKRNDFASAFRGKEEYANNDTIYVVKGCIQIQTGSFFAMYKHSTSPVARAPQCRKD